MQARQVVRRLDGCSRMGICLYFFIPGLLIDWLQARSLARLAKADQPGKPAVSQKPSPPWLRVKLANLHKRGAFLPDTPLAASAPFRYDFRLLEFQTG